MSSCDVGLIIAQTVADAVRIDAVRVSLDVTQRCVCEAASEQMMDELEERAGRPCADPTRRSLHCTRNERMATQRALAVGMHMQGAGQREHGEHTRNGLQLGWEDSLRAADAGAAASWHLATCIGCSCFSSEGIVAILASHPLCQQSSQPTRTCWSQLQRSHLCRHAQALRGPARSAPHPCHRSCVIVTGATQPRGGARSARWCPQACPLRPRPGVTTLGVAVIRCDHRVSAKTIRVSCMAIFQPLSTHKPSLRSQQRTPLDSLAHRLGIHPE